MEHWINSAVFYHIYPLGFCGAPIFNTEESPVPRLDKLAEWIPHLKSLGVTALYLGPVCQSSKHGYDTRDYYRIDTRLGDNASFKKLCEVLHAAEIKIILDGVFNHVGREFWAFQDVQERGAASQYCGWFQNLNFGGGSPLGDPFWYESWGGHYELVKLNLRNPEVADHLLGAVRMWMDEFHIDGLRLDAADCVDMDFFHALKRVTREKDPNFWLLGEIIHGDYSRWANPDTLDSVTNYECYKGLWSCHNTKNYFEIAHSLNRQYGPGGVYRNLRLYNFADNHDVDRLAGTLENKAHLQNVYTLLYAMPGIPSVYYGSEWALEDRRSPTADEALRPCLALEEMAQGDQTLCAHLSRLAAIRTAFPALQSGDYENVVIKNEQLVFRRTAGGQRVYVLLNLAGTDAAVEFPHQEPVLQDVLNGDEVFHNDGGRSYVILPPCSARILVGAPDRFTWQNPEQTQTCPVEPAPAPVSAAPVPDSLATPDVTVPAAPENAAPVAAPHGRLEGRVCAISDLESGVGGAIASALRAQGAAVTAPGEGRADVLVCLTGRAPDLSGIESGDAVSSLEAALSTCIGTSRYFVSQVPQVAQNRSRGAVVVVGPDPEGSHPADFDACSAAVGGFVGMQAARCAALGVRFYAITLASDMSYARLATQIADAVAYLVGQEAVASGTEIALSGGRRTGDDK